MRTKDAQPLAKAISVITNTDERRTVKAAIIRFFQADNPLFDPHVFGKHVEDYHKQAPAASTKNKLWKGINLLREGRDLLQNTATPKGDSFILQSVDSLDAEIGYLVRHVWNKYRK